MMKTFTKTIKKRIDLCKSLAEASVEKYKLAAILLNRRGDVISVGFNSSTRSHPLQVYHAYKVGKHMSVFVHAEIDAISRSITNKSSPGTLIVIRVTRDGNFACSRPCVICRSAIEESNIGKVIFINEKNELDAYNPRYRR